MMNPLLFWAVYTGIGLLLLYSAICRKKSVERTGWTLLVFLVLAAVAMRNGIGPVLFIVGAVVLLAGVVVYGVRGWREAKRLPDRSREYAEKIRAAMESRGVVDHEHPATVLRELRPLTPEQQEVFERDPHSDRL